MTAMDSFLLAEAWRMLAITRTGPADRERVDRTLAAVEKTRGLLARLAMQSFDDLFVAQDSGVARSPAQARAALAIRPAKANAPLTAAQRRGLARKITSYLKRSGLDCHVVESPKHGSRLLN